MLDLISHMICHMTALVVKTTAIFKGDTALAPLSEKKKINEQMQKIIIRAQYHYNLLDCQKTVEEIGLFAHKY